MLIRVFRARVQPGMQAEAVVLPGETHIFQETAVYHYEALEQAGETRRHL